MKSYPYDMPLPDPGWRCRSPFEDLKERAEKILRTSATYGIAYTRLTRLLERLDFRDCVHSTACILYRLLAGKIITVSLEHNLLPGQTITLQLLPRRFGENRISLIEEIDPAD